jgi:hypothetical protein
MGFEFFHPALTRLLTTLATAADFFFSLSVHLVSPPFLSLYYRRAVIPVWHVTATRVSHT